MTDGFPSQKASNAASVGPMLVQRWHTTIGITLCQRWPNVSVPTLGRCWHNVGPTLACNRWANWQIHVGPTLVSRRWPNVRVDVGPTLGLRRNASWASLWVTCRWITFYIIIITTITLNMFIIWVCSCSLIIECFYFYPQRRNKNRS